MKTIDDEEEEEPVKKGFDEAYYAVLSIGMGLAAFLMMFIPATTGSIACFAPAILSVISGIAGLRSRYRLASVIGLLLGLAWFAFVIIGVLILMRAG